MRPTDPGKLTWFPHVPLERKSDLVLSSFENIGVGLSDIPKDILKRLNTIELESHFNENSRRIEIAYNKLLPEMVNLFGVKFSKLEIQEARLGVLLHDVGKIGPPEADRRMQRDIIDLFAEDKILRPTTALRDAVVLRFGQAREEEVMKILLSHGFTEESTMLDFWNAHSEWGIAVLESHKDKLPGLTRLVAESHHMGRGGGKGPNPFRLPQTPEGLSALEDNMEEKKKYILALLLIVLDKFEAIKSRGGQGVTGRDILLKEGFEKNPYMQGLITLVEEKIKDPKFFNTES